MANILTDLASGVGRGIQAVGTLGLSELDRAKKEKEREKLKQLGNILAGQTVPAYASQEQTPEQIKQMQLKQLAALGTPESTNILTALSPLTKGSKLAGGTKRS